MAGELFLMNMPPLAGPRPRAWRRLPPIPRSGFVMLTTPPNARAGIVEVLLCCRRQADPDGKAGGADPCRRRPSLVELCEGRGVPLGIMLQHRARPVAADLRTR